MAIPDSARYAKDAAEAIGASFEDLDDGGGYLFRIARDGRTVLSGAGNICTYPVNSAAAYTISRDKAHTKAALRASGLPVIPGGLFFAHRRRAALRAPGREVEDAARFAARLGYPVFCKPNLGSRGTFAEIISDDAELSDYVSRICTEFEAFLIEPVLRGNEHRVFVQDGRTVFHATKAEPALVGDGTSTLANLLDALNRRIAAEGVSAVPPTSLHRDLREVPGKGERIALPGRRNLSAAGGIETVAEAVPDRLAALAITAVATIGLRVGAVDMFDLSGRGDFSDLVVIEVNGNPGLRTLELANRSDLIAGIWTSMLNECLGK